MKYLENPALSRLAQSLTHEGPECSVHTRIEAYSCKNIKRDKKLFKSLEHAYQDDLSNSPPLPNHPIRPYGRPGLAQDTIPAHATLNIAFPDYEFSDVRPSHFSREESGASVLNALGTTFASPHRAGMTAPRTYSSYPPTSAEFFPSCIPSSTSPYDQVLPSPLAPPPIVTGTHPTLFRLIDDAIGLGDCEVFSYTPEIDADPHAGDLSDDDDGFASDEEEDSSTDDDGAFEFDSYDIDAVGPMHRPAMGLRRRGALLWSSHWFFLNRKLNRILFVSVWARTRGMGRSWSEDEDEYAYDVSMRGEEEGSKERFLGWAGGAGAGARAIGLAPA
ncbi:Maf1 regulator-domain-containing protein [Infundibulicybe gibba]|nr:Maf1 regulator-domain-containing protein [Infundibulicybe gibba]